MSSEDLARKPGWELVAKLNRVPGLRLGGLSCQAGLGGHEVAVKVASEADDGEGDASHLVGQRADGAVVAEPAGQAQACRWVSGLPAACFACAASRAERAP